MGREGVCVREREMRERDDIHLLGTIYMHRR